MQQPDRAGPLVMRDSSSFARVAHTHVHAVTNLLRCYNVLYLNSVCAEGLLFSTFRVGLGKNTLVRRFF